MPYLLEHRNRPQASVVGFRRDWQLLRHQLKKVLSLVLAEWPPDLVVA
jgi:hypothetical protein